MPAVSKQHENNNVHALVAGPLTVRIAEFGAELSSLRANGKELIWQADPDIWARHAPLLFPIVGRLNNDVLAHNGKHYPISQHGFARDMTFSLVRHTANSCTLLLKDNEQTRQHYPYNFELEVAYLLDEGGLEITYRVSNPDSTDALPVSIGGHPGFIWPLNDGDERENHRITFAHPEPAPIRRLSGGLMTDSPQPTPVDNNTLALHDSLFEADAIIFDQLHSRRLTYSGSGDLSIELVFDDFPHLGIWTKPGAGFICLEPWQGYAAPETFEGEFTTKPGVISIAPGQSHSWRYRININGLHQS